MDSVHRIVLKKPGFLGEGGFVHVGAKEGMVIFLDEEYNQIGQNKDIWIDLFFYPEFGGGYNFALIIEDGEHSWWTWLTPDSPTITISMMQQTAPKKKSNILNNC